MSDATMSEGTIRVWDPVVRIGHWILVAAFATAYLTEGEPEWLHSWAGYVIAATVALRIVWGFAGPRHARFSDFVTGPRQVTAYLRDLLRGRAERHIGHSPAGGAMTVALLAALAVTALSGMANLAAEEGHGPLAWAIPAESASGDAEEGEEGGEIYEEIHEVAANLTLVFVVLHLFGIAAGSLSHKENLVAAMITGRKRLK